MRGIVDSLRLADNGNGYVVTIKMEDGTVQENSIDEKQAKKFSPGREVSLELKTVRKPKAAAKKRKN